MSNNQRFLRPLQLAEYLGVCERTVREWQAKKVIPFFKLGRVTLFDPAKVEAALEQFERKASA